MGSFAWISIYIFSYVNKGFPGGAAVKNPPTNAGYAGDPGLIPGSGRLPEEGNGNPLHYCCLENLGQRRLVAYSPRGRKE